MTGGGPGPYVNLVGLYDSWGGMQQTDPTFEQILIEELGQDGLAEWGEAFGQTFRGVEVWTQRLRPDLRVPGSN